MPQFVAVLLAVLCVACAHSAPVSRDDRARRVAVVANTEAHAVPLATPETFGTVLTVGDRAFLVLSNLASPEWGARSTLISRMNASEAKIDSAVVGARSNESVAVADVRPDRVPPKFRNWTGMRVEIFGASESLGTTSVGSLHVMRRASSADLDFAWGTDMQTGEAQTDQEYVDSFWREPSVQTLLVAELESSPRVDEAVWGRRAAEARPSVAIFDMSHELRMTEPVLGSELRLTPGFADVMARVPSDSLLSNPAAELVVNLLATNSDGSALFLMDGVIKDPVSGYVTGSESSFMYLDAHRRAHMVPMGTCWNTDSTLVVADVNGDATPEIIQRDALYALEPTGCRAVIDVTPLADAECGC